PHTNKDDDKEHDSLNFWPPEALKLCSSEEENTTHLSNQTLMKHNDTDMVKVKNLIRSDGKKEA
ncbi:hypothetical protein J0S82_019379, partial [Galemys pyrenaicus]